MQHVSVVKKWGLLHHTAHAAVWRQVGTSSRDWQTVQHVSVAKKWGLADSAACECGEEVGTGGQCSM